MSMKAIILALAGFTVASPYKALQKRSVDSKVECNDALFKIIYQEQDYSVEGNDCRVLDGVNYVTVTDCDCSDPDNYDFYDEDLCELTKDEETREEVTGEPMVAHRTCGFTEDESYKMMCGQVNFNLLEADMTGEKQGENCYIEEWEETVENCDCSDPESLLNHDLFNEDTCNYLESLANPDDEVQPEYVALVCPGFTYESEDEEDSGPGDDCPGVNWGLLWEDLKGEMQGGNCVVDGEIRVENCDCTDPENYIYAEDWCEGADVYIAAMDPNDPGLDQTEKLRGEITCGSESDEKEPEQKRECSDTNVELLWDGNKGEMQGGNCVFDGELFAENCDCTDPENYDYLDADICKEIEAELASMKQAGDDGPGFENKEKYRELACGFLTNFLSFGLIIFCTLLKL